MKADATTEAAVKAVLDRVSESYAKRDLETFPARITWVLETRGDKWLIVQANLSVPFGEQAAGESFPT